MFIEKITEEQLKGFFCEDMIQSIMSHSFENKIGINESYLYVTHRTDLGHIKTDRLYDFEGSTVPNENEWKQFLYDIFGEKYLNAYKVWLNTKRNEKIEAILQNHVEMYVPRSNQIRDSILEELQTPGNAGAYTRNIKEYNIRTRTSMDEYLQFYEDDFHKSPGNILIMYGKDGASCFINNGIGISPVSVSGKQFGRIAKAPEQAHRLSRQNFETKEDDMER